MFRYLMITAIVACTFSAGSVRAGALDALSQGGPATGQFQGLWSPDAGQQEYQPRENVQCVFRVRYYKQGWKYKRHAAFATFADAKLFMVLKKMEGYTANLAIHEFAPLPAKKDYWLP